MIKWIINHGSDKMGPFDIQKAQVPQELQRISASQERSWLAPSHIFGGFLSHGGALKSSFLIPFFIINHPAIGVPLFQETSIFVKFN